MHVTCGVKFVQYRPKANTFLAEPNRFII